MSLPIILTLEEVATVLRVSVKTVRRRIASGQLQAFKEGGRVCVLESVLKEYIESKVEGVCAR